jgi:hypothetical protein
MNHTFSKARYLAMSIAVLLNSQSAAVADPRPIELKWSELDPQIRGRKIELVLPDGALLNGEVEAVRENELVLNVKKTSDSKAHPRGNAVIPRASVNLLVLKESSGKWGRSIGVTLGALTGITLGTYVAIENTHSDATGLSTFLSLAGAGTLTGFFIGKSLDHRVKHIRVVP